MEIKIEINNIEENNKPKEDILKDLPKKLDEENIINNDSNIAKKTEKIKIEEIPKVEEKKEIKQQNEPVLEITKTEELKEESKKEIKEIKIVVNQDNIPEKNEISELGQKRKMKISLKKKLKKKKKIILENKDNNVKQNPKIEIIKTEINIQSDETNINKDKSETRPEKTEEKRMRLFMKNNQK